MKIFDIRLSRHDMRRRPRNMFFILIGLSAFVILLLVRRSSINNALLREKRDTGEPLPPDARRESPPPDEIELAPHDDPGFEPQPGTLICEQRAKQPQGEVGAPKKVAPVAPRKLPAVLNLEVIKTIPLVNGWTKVGQKVGCCPAGSSTGSVYFTGFSCCVDQVFNASEKFCCLEKKRVLDINQANVEFCYPLSRPPFCRKQDLKLIAPMTTACEYATKDKTPTACEFLCPAGTRVRGSKLSRCSIVGTWDVQPQCCEGCPSNTVKDLWFIVDVDSGVGVGGMSDVRTFIKGLTSYLPVSQTQVRVALTSYTSAVNDDKRSWNLSSINNHKELNRAINMVTSDDLGMNTGTALDWVATKASPSPGRETVFVLITTGDPDDEITSGAARLRNLGRFVVISVGPDANSAVLGSIPTEGDSNFLRVQKFADLDKQQKFLYNLLCGVNCFP